MSTRCAWANTELAIIYHDEEWGVPLHDEHRLFEYIVLDGAQAGLSWNTILNKRARYQKIFAQFDPVKVASFDKKKIESLLADPGIVRNRAKVISAVQNAKAFLAVQESHGSFDRYIWAFVDGKPIINGHKSMKEIPAVTPLSVKISKDLRQRGFNFVGPTIMYAFMQAAGMVNDHLVTCPRHVAVGR